MSRFPIRLDDKPSKYHAKRTNGFASKREAKRADELGLLLRSGIIRDLTCQQRFVLIPKSRHGPDVVYIADFTYCDCDTGAMVIEDVKGVRTAVYKLKKRLMAELGHRITEV